MPDFVVPWRTGAKPEEDFSLRSEQLQTNLTESENSVVQAKDIARNQRTSSCIDRDRIAMHEKLSFGTEAGSDLPMLWAIEILRCQQSLGSTVQQGSGE